MGPFIDYSHPTVRDNKCPKSYLDMMNDVLKYLNNELPSVQIYLAPSTLDVLHLYPLPQPKFSFDLQHKNITLIGNPSYLQAGKLTMEVINHDFPESIRNNCCGRV